MLVAAPSKDVPDHGFAPSVWCCVAPSCPEHESRGSGQLRLAPCGVCSIRFSRWRCRGNNFVVLTLIRAACLRQLFTNPGTRPIGKHPRLSPSNANRFVNHTSYMKKRPLSCMPKSGWQYSAACVPSRSVHMLFKKLWSTAEHTRFLQHIRQNCDNCD
jgi:hypothetical protein